MLESLFNKVAELSKACIFIKKRLQHRHFHVKFAKLLRTLILKNICGRLLLSTTPIIPSLSPIIKIKGYCLYYLDINECMLMGDTNNNEIQRCHPRATCYNSIGSYRCTCIQGFSGDGFDCSGNRFKFLIAILKVHRDFNSLFCFLFWSNSSLNTWQIFVSFNGFGTKDTFIVQSSGILL